MRTITLKELETQYTGTYSVKDNTPRGRKEVSFYNLKVGDEVLIDNYFTLIVEESKEEEKENKNIIRIYFTDENGERVSIGGKNGFDDIQEALELRAEMLQNPNYSDIEIVIF